MRELSTIAKACQVNVAEGNVTCPQGENRKLVTEFVSNQRSRPKSIATFAAALSREPPPTRAVAANVLYAAFRSPWGPDLKPGEVNREDADAMLNASLALPKALAREALPAAVHAAMLAGRTDALFSALDKSGNAELRSTGYRYVMTHGRLRAFAKVRELAKDANVAVVLAALESPRNMFAWTTEEQAAICPWAAGMLGDSRPAVAAKAAALLSSCTGEYVDQLLASGEKALADGKFTATELTSYRDLCASQQGRPNGPSPEQCERCRKFLTRVIESKTVDEQTRSTALVSMAYQWPDEQTQKLAQRLEKSPDKSLAEHARRTVERLNQRKSLTATQKRTR